MGDADWVDSQPLWRAIVGACGNWWSSFVICVRGYGPWDPYRQRRDGKGYHVQPWWAAWLAVPIAVGFASLQAYGHLGLRKGWPQWPWRFLAWWEDTFAQRVEDATIHYVWLPADSGDPNEIGFHALASSVTYERDADGLRKIAKRPRCYRYVPGPVVIPDGATTVTSNSATTYTLEYPL